MAWTLDTSGLLVSDGNVVTEEGQPKGKQHNFQFYFHKSKNEQNPTFFYKQ